MGLLACATQRKEDWLSQIMVPSFNLNTCREDHLVLLVLKGTVTVSITKRSSHLRRLLGKALIVALPVNGFWTSFKNSDRVKNRWSGDFLWVWFEIFGSDSKTFWSDLYRMSDKVRIRRVGGQSRTLGRRNTSWWWRKSSLAWTSAAFDYRRLNITSAYTCFKVYHCRIVTLSTNKESFYFKDT